jgi:hypothetical protein
LGKKTPYCVFLEIVHRDGELFHDLLVAVINAVQRFVANAGRQTLDLRGKGARPRIERRLLPRTKQSSQASDQRGDVDDADAKIKKALTPPSSCI